MFERDDEVANYSDDCNSKDVESDIESEFVLLDEGGYLSFDVVKYILRITFKQYCQVKQEKSIEFDI